MPTIETLSESSAKLFYNNVTIKVNVHSCSHITINSDKNLTIIIAQRDITISLELPNGIQSTTSVSLYSTTLSINIYVYAHNLLRYTKIH